MGGSRGIGRRVAAAAVGAVLLATTLATASGPAGAEDPAPPPPDGPPIIVDPLPPLEVQRQALFDAAPLPAPFPYAETFALHSNPASQRTIYLDFDGHTVAGTRWNDQSAPPNGYDTPSSWDADPWDIDGNPTTFSAAEMDLIQAVYLRVREDYAPFDVDVTTEEPPQADITRSSAADQVYGTRVIITDDEEMADLCSCGGIAFIGVFDTATGIEFGDHAQYQPAFVFTRTGNLPSTAKFIAEAASHEAGHNLGLTHDGTSTATYYSGHASWAPIMGNAYSRPVSQFSLADYPDAVNIDPGTGLPMSPKQDDLAVIAAGGAPLLPDDTGSTNASADQMSGPGPWSSSGIIGTRADADWFAVTVPSSGQLAVSATGSPVGPNLDIRLGLRNASSELASADPPVATVSNEVASGLDASLTRAVTAGTYWITIDGVGSGTATTGYTDYGSIGHYTWSASFTPVATPTLTVAPVSVTEGDTTTVNASFTFQLSAPASSTVSVKYATANGTAVAGSDYTAKGLTTLSFSPGQTTKVVNVSVKPDRISEDDETFSLVLSSPVGLTLSSSSATGTIIDDEPPKPVVSINDVHLAEGSSGTRNAVFTVSLVGSMESAVSVTYQTANGTAVAPGDYTAKAPTVLTFSVGQTAKTISVPIKVDAFGEDDEGFFVVLSKPVGVVIGDGIGIGLIENDDPPPPSVTVDDVAIVEGDGLFGKTMVFTIRLSAPAPGTVSLKYATANGTAVAPGDYAAKALTSLSFSKGQTSKTVSVTIKSDNLAEADETFSLLLSAPSAGLTIADGTAVGTIVDDD